MSNILVQRRPVHAEFMAGGEVKSYGISFGDYERMQTFVRKLNVGRRYEAPTWAYNDDELLAVIRRSMEERALLFQYELNEQMGTDKERLMRAAQQLERMRPNLVARLDNLCNLFVSAKRDGLDETSAVYAIQVTGLDTQLRTLSDMAKILAGVVYFYWRCCYDSVFTGAQLGIKPPHVRQLLSRMLEAAKALGFAPPGKIIKMTRPPRPRAPKEPRVTRTPEERQEISAQLRLARAQRKREERAQQRLAHVEEQEAQTAQIIEMRKAGKFTVDIARELGLGTSGSEIVNRVLIQAGLR